MKITLNDEAAFLVFIFNIVYTDLILNRNLNDKIALVIFVLMFFMTSIIINFLFF